MSLLSIAGVVLPVTVDSCKASLEAVGAVARNQRGHRLLERRRNKWVIEFDLSPCSIDEAQLYKALLLGEGEFWSCLSSAFGSKGLGLTGSGAMNLVGGGNPLSTNGVWRMTAGQTLVVPGRLYDQSALTTAPAALTGATLIGWRYDGAAYRLVGISWRALDTAPAVKREKLGALGSSGAAQAYTGTETFATSTSTGELTITAPGAGGPWSWSNLVVYPWAFAQAQVDALLDGFAGVTYRLPDLPSVYVQSDLVAPTDQLKATPGLVQGSLVCQGELAEFAVEPLVIGGAWSTAVHVSGSLVEV